MLSSRRELKPQPGFQTKFLSSQADIVVGGGAAGGGKTYALLLEPTRHLHRHNFTAYCFRRLTPDITTGGGLWDTSMNIYPYLPGYLRSSNKTHHYTKRVRLQFAHLQYDTTTLTYQGSQLPLIMFDELTQFSSYQFWYMLGRNRLPDGLSGMVPYIRATTNPQGSGWVKDLVSWYLYPDDYIIQELAGYPIPERAGVITYFVRYRGRIIMRQTEAEVLDELPADIAMEYLGNVKTFAFVPGLLSDNQKLLSKDPSYKANLLAQDVVNQEKLLKGRWLDPDDEERRLFNYNALKDLFTNDFVPRGKRYITADIALEGSDKMVVYVWEGWRVIDIKVYAKTTPEQVVEILANIKQQYQVPGSHVCFDADGVGNIVRKYIGQSAYNFRGGGKPLPYKGEKIDYVNLKTQCAYYCATKVNQYDSFINCTSTDRHISEIVQELFAHKKTGLDSKGRTTMTDKKTIKVELGRSPDYADAYFMRAVFDLKGVTDYSSVAL